MRVTAILLAAGKGQRFKSRISKPLVKLGGYPLLNYSLGVLNRHPLIRDIIIVVNSANKKAILKLVKKSGYNKISFLVLGGTRRQDSVFNGLKKVKADSNLVLIHDSARPFIRPQEISVLITRAKHFGAAILGVPLKDTIKESVARKSTVKKTLNRDNLWQIQTPQVFKRDLIFRAYEKFRNFPATDDAMLVEKLPAKVSIVRGSYHNKKITTPEDLIIAEAMLRHNKVTRNQ